LRAAGSRPGNADRLGEYKDALILIQRYPILGVGFSGSPDIDTYIGVSNMYLLIAEEMGLVGLTAYMAIIARRRSRCARLPAHARERPA
jgi:O-antigen ligase